MKKSESLLYVEECFTKVKNNKDREQALSIIAKTLQREFGIITDIAVIDNTSRDFFAMNIYPHKKYLTKLAYSLVDEKKSEDFVSLWKDVKAWQIEIDSLLLDDFMFDVTSGELTALLLHEIGHVIYSDEVPRLAFKTVKLNLFKRSPELRSILSEKSQVNKLLMAFPIIEACNAKSFSKRKLREELNADEFVRMNGYGLELYTFVDKLIMYGKGDLVEKSNIEKEQEIAIIVNWSFDQFNNMRSLSVRKRKLYRALKLEMVRNPSNTIKYLCQSINEVMFKEPEHSFLNTNEVFVAESSAVTAIVNAAKKPARFLDKMHKVKPCKLRDLDVLEVEIQNIKNIDDKMFILECLHDELDRANYALNLIDENRGDKVPQSKPSLNAYAARVQKLIEICKNTPIPQETYGLYIKYPKGYEG